MNHKKIIVEIDEDGNCSLDGQGFVGPECSKFLGEVEEALGETTSREDKEAMRQRVSSRETETQTE